MMQLDLIDPRSIATVTQAMHDDRHLRSAIRFVRADYNEAFRWPYVEALCEIEARQAWAVDDDGTRYVVVGPIVFPVADLAIADERIRTAAMDVFGRLNFDAAHPGLDAR